MVKKSVISLLVMMIVFIGCGEDEPEKIKPKEVFDEKEVVDEEPKKRIIWKKDGAEMRLIPAGSFGMGDHFNQGRDPERPVHRVEQDAFYMDSYEVTVGQFKQFVEESGYDAAAYAKWVGKRLPTEAEWEYAARGGLIGKRYPWGDQITHDDANYSDTGGRDKWEFCAPVGSFAANGYGLYDMAGNVWEWCSDWYGVGYYATSPNKNPQGPDTGQYRVLRGGSWGYRTNGLRVADRGSYGPNGRRNGYGFRCVSGSVTTGPFTSDRVAPLLLDADESPATSLDMTTSKIELPASTQASTIVTVRLYNKDNIPIIRRCSQSSRG